MQNETIVSFWIEPGAKKTDKKRQLKNKILKLSLSRQNHIWANADGPVTEVLGGQAVVRHVTQDQRVLRQSEEGIHVGFTVLIVSPVEVDGKGTTYVSAD